MHSYVILIANASPQMQNHIRTVSVNKNNHTGDLYTGTSAGREKTCDAPNLCTSVVEHVKTVLRLNLHMAVFNKLENQGDVPEG